MQTIESALTRTLSLAGNLRTGRLSGIDMAGEAAGDNGMAFKGKKN